MPGNETVDIHDVAKNYNLSTEVVRKYKLLGVLKPCQRVGGKDFFDKEEMFIRKDLIQSFEQRGLSLNEIKDEIVELEIKDDFQETIDSNRAAKKILIVEDNEDVMDVVKSFLRAHYNEDELTIVDVKSGYLAMEIAEKIKPDLILLDIVLPDISGIEVYNHLESHASTSHTKFIILSGKVGFEPSKAIFLKKPVNVDEFIPIVKRLLQIETTLPVE